MDWILTCALMFLSSVCLYMFIRKATLQKIPYQYLMVTSIGVPVILYLIYGIATHENFSVSGHQLAVLIITAVFFSYLGNIFSLKGIQDAPNPGYSIIITKASIIFVTIMAVLLFGEEITPQSLLAILLIVVFSVLLIGDSEKEKRAVVKQTSWVKYSIAAMLCFALLSIASKYSILIGISTISRLSYVSVFVLLILVGELIIRRQNLKRLNPSELTTLIICGIFSAFSNYFMQDAYRLSPNIGYVNAISASTIAAVTLLCAMVFKDELNPKKIFYVMGVTAGLIILIV